MQINNTGYNYNITIDSIIIFMQVKYLIIMHFHTDSQN